MTRHTGIILLLICIVSISTNINANPSSKLDEAHIENPQTFYPHYLKKLKALPENKQLNYAANLPIESNPANIHRMNRRVLEDKIDQAKASGLGHRHPELTLLHQQLNELNTTHAKTALRITLEILEGKRDQPNLVDQEIAFLNARLNQMLTIGLGKRHPNIILLKKRIRTLEKEKG